MRVYRIVTLAHARNAFTGEGARLYGGRWNPKGFPLVYTAATRSLALLEMLVQDQPLRARYAFIPADVPANVRITRLAPAQLPADWRHSAARIRLQEIGREWLVAGRGAVLAVPSVVLPEEENFLLNPRHASFTRIRPEEAEPLELDSRLLRYG